MVVALWANLEVPFNHLPVNDLITGVAFRPELLGKLRFSPFLFGFLLVFFSFLKQRHRLRSCPPDELHKRPPISGDSTFSTTG
jgi:hypothetical protein